MLKPGINYISNKDYHADKNYLSSSNFKQLNTDTEDFYNDIILGNKESVSKAVFDEGSYVHSLILEPELIEAEFAFFEGMRKAGPDFKAFKLQNLDKVILSKPQRVRCERALKFYKQRKEAVALIAGGFAEHTICGEIAGIKIKTRSDYINVEEGYIIDVKTSGFPVDIDSFRMTMNQFSYDLSAALYCMIAEQYYEREFDFYFIAISKKEDTCEVFKMKEATMLAGRQAIMKAIRVYKQCMKTGNWSNEAPTARVTLSDYEILEI